MMELYSVPIDDQLQKKLDEEEERNPGIVTKADELADSIIEGLDDLSDEARTTAACRFLLVQRELAETMKLLLPPMPGPTPEDERLDALEAEMADLYQRALAGDVDAMIEYLAIASPERWGPLPASKTTQGDL